MASTVIPSLPKECTMQYVAEGAANIVYRISIPTSPNAEPRAIESNQVGQGILLENKEIIQVSFISNKLLRVRKNLATTIPCAFAQEAWTRLILPLFPLNQLVIQSLVEVRTENIISRLNESLTQWEQSIDLDDTPNQGAFSRPFKRRGVYLADDEHGLLVTDMSIGPDCEEVIEFKPKWLALSPSAPAAAKRCRTCANVARKNAAAALLHEPLEKSFCPLDLISPDYAAIYTCAEAILPPNSINVERFARWIQSNSLITRLRNYQQAMDQQGVMNPDMDNENLLIAMTLRDCTIFVKFLRGKSQDGAIEARIGDLDIKSPHKAAYWKDIETRLITEGWYMGLEKPDAKQPLTCSLSRT